MNIHFRPNQLPFIPHDNRMAFDCHFHTRYSDGSGKVADILKAARKLGIGIAITDHNEIKGALEAWNNALGVPVIPGIEVSCKGMIHLLVYFYRVEDLRKFYEKYIAPYRRVDTSASLKEMTALKIAKVARQYKCVVALAHPYGGTHRKIDSFVRLPGNDKFFHYIDCVEGLNGTINKKRNQKSIALAQAQRKRIVGGSDGHTVSSLGKAVTIAKAGNIGEFLNCLKSGDVEIIGQKMNLYQRSKIAGVISYKHVHASTKKHHKTILASLGLYALFQTLTIPLVFLLGAIGYKKVKERKRS